MQEWKNQKDLKNSNSQIKANFQKLAFIFLQNSWLIIFLHIITILSISKTVGNK